MNNKKIIEKNKKGYELFFIIENVIRELLIEVFLKLDGPQWYKRRIPGGDSKSPLEKYKASLDYEKKINWTSNIFHHPIYYIDFPDLKTIIEKKDNWKDLEKIFTSRKEVIITLFTELEPIRNKIAHNRIITDSDVTILETSTMKIKTMIGADNFSNLSEKLTEIKELKEKFIEIKTLGNENYINCVAYKNIKELEKWNEVKKAWWFDETYLGNSITQVINFFTKLEEYDTIKNRLKRGDGYLLEKWVKDNNLSVYYKNFTEEIENLI